MLAVLKILNCLFLCTKNKLFITKNENEYYFVEISGHTKAEARIIKSHNFNDCLKL